MRRGYPSDLTDEQWAQIAPLFARKPTGRPPELDRREVVNAILPLVRTGCQWRYLPGDFPGYSSVHTCYRRWRLDALKWRGSRLRFLRTDAGYTGALASWASRVLGCLVEIVRRPKGQKGFVVLKGRWVIERTFGWLGRSRRLWKDYEETPESSRAMILWSMTHLMLKRLHPLPV